MKERITLDSHFTFRKLIRFVLPSIFMMLFISIYGIVDGFFVSNFVGEIQFAALNLIYPFIMILGAVGFMLGVGGNAIVAQELGRKDEERANRVFTFITITTAIVGTTIATIGIICIRPIAVLFAKSEKMLSAADKQILINYCVQYGRVLLAALPFFMLQNAFQGFFVTAEKPRLGLLVTIFAGCSNILLDALFVIGFKWGLLGAAAATACNQVLGGVFPLFYFGRKNDSLLRFTKTHFDGKVLLKTCSNGISELMSNVALSLVAMLYNVQLMNIVGINGVSAYGVVQYIGFIFISIFIGYSIGSSPIVGYNYGANNEKELKNVFKKSLCIVGVLSVAMAILGVAFARPFASIFVSHDKALLDMTTTALRVNAVSFLFCGWNIFASSFFTALGSGSLSLLISFSRTFIFQVICVFTLPVFFGLMGVWSALVVAEVIGLLLSLMILVLARNRFHYA